MEAEEETQHKRRQIGLWNEKHLYTAGFFTSGTCRCANVYPDPDV
jgi:hypothetical protein